MARLSVNRPLLAFDVTSNPHRGVQSGKTLCAPLFANRKGMRVACVRTQDLAPTRVHDTEDKLSFRGAAGSERCKTILPRICDTEERVQLRQPEEDPQILVESRKPKFASYLTDLLGQAHEHAQA